MIQSWQYIVVVILGTLLWYWLWERRERRRFRDIPSYSLLPFIGNIHQVFGDSKALFRHMTHISKVCESHESRRFVVWIGPFPLLVLQDPEDVRTITNAFVEKPYFYSFAKIWLGDGLVTAPGSIWKQNIKRLAGTFNTSVVNGYLDVFNVQARKLVDNLQAEVGKEPFDIMHKYLAYTTMEAICQTALGVPKISQNTITREYYVAFNRCLKLLIERGLNALVHPNFIYKLTPAYQKMKHCVGVLHNVSDQEQYLLMGYNTGLLADSPIHRACFTAEETSALVVLQCQGLVSYRVKDLPDASTLQEALNKVMIERKLEREKSTKEESKEKKTSESAKPKFRAFLDILLDLKEVDPSLTEQHIKSEVDTIIVGGLETVASTMYFILLMIGCNTRVQDKLYAELESIFGDSDRHVTIDDLTQMKYLEAVIYETLRLFPPVPGVMRYADRHLPIKSLTIPKGTICVINSWGTGRSVSIWGKDAAVYRPERWLEHQTLGNAASFLAFSYGRRSCIGKKYAMAILKTVIARCVREMEFVSEGDKMQFKLDIALRPTTGHLIKVRRRTSLRKR